MVSTIGTPMYEVAEYLASLLKLIMDKTEYHARNSAAFPQAIDTLQGIP